MQKIIFYYWKNEKIPEVPSSGHLMRSLEPCRTCPTAKSRAGHLRYFWIFSIIKNWFFAFFIQLICAGSGLFKKDWCGNRLLTLHKLQEKSFFIIENIQKYRKCPALLQTNFFPGFFTIFILYFSICKNWNWLLCQIHIFKERNIERFGDKRSIKHLITRKSINLGAINVPVG